MAETKTVRLQVIETPAETKIVRFRVENTPAETKTVRVQLIEDANTMAKTLPGFPTGVGYEEAMDAMDNWIDSQPIENTHEAGCECVTCGAKREWIGNPSVSGKEK